MEVGTFIQEEMMFRGAEFAVKVDVQDRLLTVEINDIMTADQWKGEFDPAYIEDLTRKTGNFKQFPIFCSMLESAVSKSSESVTLDLLTYSDLELLRNKKAGVAGRSRVQKQAPSLTSKRYLILIYTVEFDRIHYPLPLPYLGKPDPAVLQREIRALRAELNALGMRGGHTASDQETRRLRAELTVVREEKDALAKALERLQLTGPSSPPGAHGLREAVRSLEEQLLRERAKSQRSASKRGQEQRHLMEQLEELRASERALRIRVKSLTTEVAVLRRGRMTPVLSGRSGSRGEEFQQSSSREHSLTRVGMRARSGSRERVENKSRRSEERGRRAGSSGTQNYISRSSPSPLGSRGPRFDPTAYIQEKHRRQKEADLKNQRKVRRDMLASPVLNERGRSRSREPLCHLTRAGSAGRGRSVSVESRRSGRRSSESSMTEFEELAKPLNSRSRRIVHNGPNMTRGRQKKPMCSTPAQRMRESYMDTGADLSEIDARLQALQEYMRDLDTGH
ncbi:centrosomal protein CCDC61 [Brachyhypopomus gauderio]|uniref:centrosomal protein CCDC61 n=1 Tax=Brachyhypopomus gauderio TaxID=698409 RepID=UPI00404386A9